jgi:hypothetical protein
MKDQGNLGAMVHDTMMAKRNMEDNQIAARESFVSTKAKYGW